MSLNFSLPITDESINESKSSTVCRTSYKHRFRTSGRCCRLVIKGSLRLGCERSPTLVYNTQSPSNARAGGTGDILGVQEIVPRSQVGSNK